MKQGYEYFDWFIYTCAVYTSTSNQLFSFDTEVLCSITVI